MQAGGLADGRTGMPGQCETCDQAECRREGEPVRRGVAIKSQTSPQNDRPGETNLRDLTELRSLQDWVVERQMRLAPGVADVVTLGGFLKQYQVNLDLAKAGVAYIQCSDLPRRGGGTLIWLVTPDWLK